MRTRLLHILIQSLLILLFFRLSPAYASPAPISLGNFPSSHIKRHSSQPRAPPPPKPNTSPPDEDPYTRLTEGYNLKFKHYPQWIKEKSKLLWESHKDRKAREAAIRSYTSPYLTKFADKKDGWWSAFDFGRIWRHFLWEVLPELWRKSELPREDVFLLRAMEQPSYMSPDKLPELFRAAQMNRKTEDTGGSVGTTSPDYDNIIEDRVKNYPDNLVDF